MPLPPNLSTLYEEEERLRKQSLAFIESRPALKDHVDIVQASLNLIFDFTTLHKASTDDELTIQLLGIRLFNATVSVLRLTLSGYYQNAFTVHRDLVETSFLLDFLTINKSQVTAWKKSSRKERETEFRPKVVREALNNRDGAGGLTKRDSLYWALCEMGSHPTYAGARVIAPQRFAKIGPFFDENLLEITINELALRLPHATLFYVQFFPSVDPGLVQARGEQVTRLDEWMKKYFGKSIVLEETVE